MLLLNPGLGIGWALGLYLTHVGPGVGLGVGLGLGLGLELCLNLCLGLKIGPGLKISQNS